MYHNTADYRCRDDYYSTTSGPVNGGNNSITGRISTASPSSAIQLQGQGQQQHHHQQQQQQNHQSQHHHHHHQMSQQPSQHHYHHYNPQQQINSSGAIQQLQQHQQHAINTCSPTATAIDPVDDTLNCSLALGNGRMVAATQTHQNSNCDQAAVVPTTLPMSSLQSQVPPIMYTVHRVVTTAQIQTAGGNTFTSSSSVSSVVSAVRNETDNMGNVLTPVSTSSNTGCFVASDIANCTANIVTDGNVNPNVATNQTHMNNSTGMIKAILIEFKILR